MGLFRAPPTPTAHTLTLLGQVTLIDAPICGSEAYRTIYSRLVEPPAPAHFGVGTRSLTPAHQTGRGSPRSGRTLHMENPPDIPHSGGTGTVPRCGMLYIRLKPPLPTLCRGQGSPHGLPHREYRCSLTFYSPKSPYIIPIHRS